MKGVFPDSQLMSKALMADADKIGSLGRIVLLETTGELEIRGEDGQSDVQDVLAGESLRAV